MLIYNLPVLIKFYRMLLRSKNLNFLLVGFAISLIFISGCKKDNSQPDNPYNGRTSAMFNPDLTYGTMTDQEGNIYKTITIGDQTWMAENLRTTIYNDGTEIPDVANDSEWVHLTSGAYCNYNNNSNADTIATYGRLYNWFAVGTGKLAPKGWHVSSDEEWWLLADYLGGKANAGGYLKESGTYSWIDPNIGASNSSGFTALAAGSRFGDGTFVSRNYSAHFWRSEKYLDIYGISWYLSYSYPMLGWAFYLKQFGFSVRCVKD
jgi:uncharacterized protein (TIGR02145 family)